MMSLKNVVSSRRPYLTVLFMGAACLLSACTASPQEPIQETPTISEPTSISIPDITSYAVLDASTALIDLPLDRYSMTPQEVQIALAAQQIVFAQCVTGSSDVSTVTVDTAKRTVAYRDDTPDWLYGFWDASFIASQGWRASGNGVAMGDGLEMDPAQGKECVTTQQYLDLMPLGPYYYGASGSAAKLTLLGEGAYARTMADPRFLALMDARSECVAAQGFTVSQEGGFASVDFPKEWSEEQRLKAALAEAQCSDDENLAQQAGDINATYQQQYIDANQAELNEIKKQADERVAKAMDILREAGVM